MKAFISETVPASAKIDYKNEKRETIDCYVLIDISTKTEILRAKWYMGRSNNASKVYCNIFNYPRSASGSAGGYGYCKRSAAFSAACEYAGITFDHGIDGRGMSIVREALLAIGVEMGYSVDNLFIVSL